MHTVIPGQHLFCLILHYFYLVLPKGDCPVDRTKGVTGNIECKQFPEFYWDGSFEVSVHHTGGKVGGLLSTPDNTVKFLPWVAIVAAVKINDKQFSVSVDHHIANMIVSVLICLRPAFEQMAVVIYVIYESLSVFIVDGTGKIFINLSVHLSIKTGFPIFLCLGSRNGMNFGKNFSGLNPIEVLLGLRIPGDDLSGILAVYPALNRINPLRTSAKFDGLADGNAKRGNPLHILKLYLFGVIVFFIGDAKQISGAIFVCNTVFLIAGPAFIDNLFRDKPHLNPS